MGKYVNKKIYYFSSHYTFFLFAAWGVRRDGVSCGRVVWEYWLTHGRNPGESLLGRMLALPGHLSLILTVLSGISWLSQTSVWLCFSLLHLYLSLWCVKKKLYIFYTPLILLVWLHVPVSVQTVQTLLLFAACFFQNFICTRSYHNRILSIMMETGLDRQYTCKCSDFIFPHFLFFISNIDSLFNSKALSNGQKYQEAYFCLWFSIPVELDCDDLLVFSVPPHASSCIYVYFFVYFYRCTIRME